MKVTMFLVGIVLLLPALLFAQCPPPDSIKINIIRNRVKVEKDEVKKLSLLLDYKNQYIKCHYNSGPVYAWLLDQIAWRYKEQGRYSTAIAYLQESIEATKTYSKGGIADTTVIWQYYWLFNWNDSVSNSVDKRKAADSCIAVTERLQIPFDANALRCLLDRFQYFYDIGEYKLCINDAETCEKKALEYVKRELNLQNINFGKFAAMNSFHWHVNALLQLKKFQEAEKMLANKATEYKKSGDKDYLALTYAQLAEVYVEKNDYRQALLGFQQALQTYAENRDMFSCKQTLKNIGEQVYFNYYKDYDKALLYYKKALLCTNSDNSWQREDAVESLSIYGNIANVFVQKKLFDSAFLYFNLAFNQIKKGTDVSVILNGATNEFIRLKKIDYLSNLLVNYGDAFKKKYFQSRQSVDIQNAIRIYTVADRLLAMINISQFEPESRLLWRKDSRRLYESAIEACYLFKDAEQAFYFFERSRAVLLNIQLAQQNWMGYADIAALSELNRKIAALTSAVEKTDTNQKYPVALKDSLRKKNDEYYNLLQLIKDRNPLYFQNQDTALLTIAEVRKKVLVDHQAIVELFSGDSAVYCLLLTAGNTEISKINKTDFEKAVGLYTAYLSNHNLLNKDFTGYSKSAHELYGLIFRGKMIPEGRVIISPEGSYFPFESLITGEVLAKPVYFIASHAVSYTYSIRYLFNNFSANNLVPKGNFLGIAPVNYHLPERLAALPGSDYSLQNIQATVSESNLLIAQDATRLNFSEQFPKYKIIQLYTHASDSSNRMEPVIYFHDAALYLSELVPGQKPVTSLIVLSACETANGKLYQGEGVFSFNRGFAALGIPSSVSNLWSVNSKATYAVNELFYKYMVQGLPLDVAMQKAKLEYMNADQFGQNSLPYYWAAPILVGKTDPIALDKPFAWKYWLAGAGLAGLAFFGWQKFKRKKSLSPVRDTVQTAP